MCSEQTMTCTLRDWLRDPMIRLVMESDGVTERDMIALVRRVAIAAASRGQTFSPMARTPEVEHCAVW
jgi:hypothetical protein